MKSLSRFPGSPATTYHHPRQRPLRRHIFSASIPKRLPTTAAHPSLSAQQQSDVRPMVVVGSANADIYVEIDRLPMVGETISARTGQTLAGGKGANQACCGGKLAHPTYFVGQVGEDAHGRLIEEALEGGGVMLGHLSRVPAAPTGHAVVMLQPDGQNSIIIVGGANMCCWPERLLEEDLEVIRRAGVLLLQREIPDRVNIQVAEVILPLRHFLRLFNWLLGGYSVGNASLRFSLFLICFHDGGRRRCFKMITKLKKIEEPLG